MLVDLLGPRYPCVHRRHGHHRRPSSDQSLSAAGCAPKQRLTGGSAGVCCLVVVMCGAIAPGRARSQTCGTRFQRPLTRGEASSLRPAHNVYNKMLLGPPRREERDDVALARTPMGEPGP